MPELHGAGSLFPMDPFLMVGLDDLDVFSHTRTAKTSILKSPELQWQNGVEIEMRRRPTTKNYARKTLSHPISPWSSHMEDFFWSAGVCFLKQRLS